MNRKIKHVAVDSIGSHIIEPELFDPHKWKITMSGFGGTTMERCDICKCLKFTRIDNSIFYPDSNGNEIPLCKQNKKNYGKR